MKRKIFIYSSPWFGVLLTIFLNCPNAVKNLKEVWLLTEMTSVKTTGAMTIPNCKNWNCKNWTFLYAFTKWQIYCTLMKIWRNQNIESHAILLHFTLNIKSMQIETYLLTKTMLLIITCAGWFPQFFQMP